MAFGDLDKATSTSMQDWAFGSRSETPAGKTEDLFKTEFIHGEERLWIPEWKKWNDLYRTVPELKGRLDTMALWIAGLGWTSKKHEKVLKNIRGNGKDVFDSIIMNMILEYLICGDSYAEKPKRKDGTLVNLKPLTPGDIQTVGSDKGMIKRYEQVSNELDPDTGRMKVLSTWEPDEIFHLSWNRVAMEIHGIPTPEKVESQIKKLGMAKDITAVIHRRHMVPVIIWEVDTDDPTEMAAFKTKQDDIFKNVENLVVPAGSAKATILQMQKGSIEESIAWIKSLDEGITKAIGVPNVTSGSESGSSEATSKILHLNFQPRAAWHRRFIEMQMKAQLGIDISFKEPPSIDPSLLTDARKNTGDNPTDNKLKEVK